MALTAADYTAQLQALLPPGAAWSREPQATLTQVLSALAAEFARLDARAEQLLVETDPRTTAELLADLERVAGLPDRCSGLDATTGERRAALVTRITTLGGQSPAYYVALAAAIGYDITVTEYVPHTVADDVDTPLIGELWLHWWQVTAPLDTVIEFTVQDFVTDPLASWGNDSLECLIRRLKPAHTEVLFAYT